MKKILLSAALFAAAFTGVNAQCIPTYIAGDNITSEGAYSIDGFYLGSTEGTKWDTSDDVTVTDYKDGDVGDSADENGYRDATSSVLNLKPDNEYSLLIYSKWVSTGRPAHHQKVWIDFDGDGCFDTAGEEIAATASPVTGGTRMFFTTPATVTKNVNLLLRIAIAKAASDIEDNTITAAGVIPVGEVEDYTITFPGVIPPSTVKDNIPMVNLGTEVILDVVANDVKGDFEIDQVVLASSVTATGVSITVDENNKVLYTPVDGFRGVDAFSYKIVDTEGTESTEVGVKIVVYGKKGDVLMIEDFDTSDETLGGVVSDDAVYNWDGSFNQNFANSTVQFLGIGTGKANDDGESFGDDGGSMFIGLANNTANTVDAWVVNDTHTGNKASAANDATKLQFSAADDNHFIGMQVMVTEVKPGQNFGLNIKEVETGIVHFLKADASTFTEWEWNLVSFDLSEIQVGGVPTEYKGKYVLHSIGYGADIDVLAIDAATAWYFYIDEVGMYPTQQPLASSSTILEGVNIYPNPVMNVLNVKAGKDAEVTVVNALGSVIFKGKTEVINTQSWNKGLYFVVVKEGAKTKTVKVIK